MKKYHISKLTTLYARCKVFYIKGKRMKHHSTIIRVGNFVQNEIESAKKFFEKNLSAPQGSLHAQIESFFTRKCLFVEINGWSGFFTLNPKDKYSIKRLFGYIYKMDKVPNDVKNVILDFFKESQNHHLRVKKV